jgi:hypothetical protein
MKADDLPEAEMDRLRSRGRSRLRFYMARMAAERTARPTSPKPFNLRRSIKTIDALAEGFRAECQGRDLGEHAESFERAMRALDEALQHLMTIEPVLPELQERRTATPRKNSRKMIGAMTQLIIAVALDWRSTGLKPTAGMEGKDRFRVSPFQTFMWDLAGKLPAGLRPRNRRQFAESVKGALDHLHRGK